MPQTEANAAKDAPEADLPTHVLLVDGDRRHARELEQVIRPIVSQVRTCSSTGEAIERLGDGECDLVLTNYELLDDGDSEAFLDAVGPLREEGRVLLYTGEGNRDRLALLLGEYGLMNLLARNGSVDREELLVTLQKILKRDIFGLEKYFPWGAPKEQMTLHCSSERGEMLDRTRRFVESIGLRSRLVEQLATVTDELATNALYNAPVDEAGERIYAHLSRTEEVVLPQGRGISVQWMSDGRRLGIGVRDPYGSLTAPTVLDYLAKCFRKGSDQVDTKEGGAGLGLYYVFESTSQLVVNVAPGVCTEMIALLDIQVSYREFASRCKSVHVFVQDEACGP